MIMASGPSFRFQLLVKPRIVQNKQRSLWMTKKLGSDVEKSLPGGARSELS